MHAGNLEDKGKNLLSCMSNEGNMRFTFPRRTKESEVIMILQSLIIQNHQLIKTRKPDMSLIIPPKVVLKFVHISSILL